MNKLVFSLFLLSFACSSCSLFQKTNENEALTTIQGDIKDSVYQVPIPASLTVSYNDKLIAETQSNDSGLYVLSLPRKYLNKEVVFEIQPSMNRYIEKKNAYGKHSFYIICKDKEQFRFILIDNHDIMLKVCLSIEQGKVSH